MFQRPPSARFGLLAGLFLAGGLVWSSIILTRAWLSVSESQVLAVTGSARRSVRSDLIILRGAFTVEAPKLLSAQDTLKAHKRLVEQFLTAKGVTNSAFSPIGIEEIRERTGASDGSQGRTIGYRLNQAVRIESPDVDRIVTLAGETAELLEKGVLFVSNAPEFIYTKAGEAKIEMLGEATRDARARAEQIADVGGRKVKGLRSARMGVFQITPVFSNATSWDGINDTTSLEKTITAVVNAQFAFE